MFTNEQVRKVVKACTENFKIKDRFEVNNVLAAMRSNEQVTDDEVELWLRETINNESDK